MLAEANLPSKKHLTAKVAKKNLKAVPLRSLRLKALELPEYVAFRNPTNHTPQLTHLACPISLKQVYQSRETLGSEIDPTRASLAQRRRRPGLSRHQGLQRSVLAICRAAAGRSHRPGCTYGACKSGQEPGRRVAPWIHLHAGRFVLAFFAVFSKLHD